MARPRLYTEDEAKARRTASYKKWLKKSGKRRVYAVKSYAKSLPRILLASARHRAKDHDLPFDITLEDIVIPERCPMLGVLLDVAAIAVDREWKNGPRPYAPSLDRIIPALGYVRGNVRVISWRANRIKADATPDELCAIAAFMLTQGG